MFKAGEVVGVTRLRNSYDQYVVMVLSSSGHIDRQETERKQFATGKSRRAPASFKILKAMPTDAEYAELRRKKFTSSASELMSQAYSDLICLAEEMREWYDNLTEGLQQTDRGQRVEQAADALENISEQDSTDLMNEVDVYHLPSLDTSSRAKRASEVASILQSVAAACHDYVNEHKESKHESEESESSEESEESASFEESDYDELENIADQCENDAGDVENVEFPGMYD